MAGINIGVIEPVDPALGGLLKELGYSYVPVPEAALAAAGASAKPLPEIVIVDVRGRPALLEQLGSVRGGHSSIHFILVAVLDAQLMLRAMRAGITECVTEPLDRTQLDAAIKRASSADAAAQGRVFAFVGAKGGVGTTTLGVNTATILAMMGYSVLFVDLHLAYADAALYFGAEPRFSVIDALENAHRLDSAFFSSLVAKTESGVDLLACADRDPGRPVAFRGLPTLIDVAKAHYAFVVLDVPRSGRAVVDPLAHADTIVVVANHELAALRNASHLAAGLRERYGATRVSVVVSRFDSMSQITPKDIERAIGEPVRKTFPSDYRVAVQALNNGQPLVIANHTKLASSIENFALALAGVTKEAAPHTRPGLLGRLTGKRG